MFKSATRLLLTAGIAVGAWFGASYATTYFALPEVTPHAVTGVVAVLTWLIAGRVLAAATNTMSFVNDEAASSTPALPARPAHFARVKPEAGKKDEKSEKDCGCSAPETGQRKTMHQNSKITIEAVGEENGSLKVVFTAAVSGGEFKDKQSGLRSKLESVSGIKWSHPQNLHDGKRQMEGRVARVVFAKAIAELKRIADRYA